MSNRIKNLLNMIEMPKEGILSIPVEDNEYCKVVLFMMPTGQYLSPHTSTMPANIYVVQGTAIFTLGDEEHDVKTGDCFFMPPNYNHAVRSTEDFVFVLILNK